MKKIVASILCTLAGAIFGAGAIGKVSKDKLQNVQSYSDKHLALFLMMNEWVKIKQEGKNLAEYFEKNGYKKIAIYGMSYVGETLVDELEGTDIKIVYAIDKNADSIYSNIEVLSLEEELKEVDVIVVTAITFFNEIEEMLSGKVACPVLSLEDILYEI